MKALISAYHESAACAWCNKTAECVTVQFDGGFLQKSELCFRCLQQSVRVHHKQTGGDEKPAGEGGGRKPASP
jgi:hypothetical protein